MALITNNALQAVIDKLTRYAATAVGDVAFDPTFNAGLAQAAAASLVGGGGLATYINAIGDDDVEGDLLGAARDLEETNPTLVNLGHGNQFLTANTLVVAMLTAVAHHLNRYAIAPTLDAYLTGLNTSVPTLRAHAHFAKYLLALTPRNVFIPNDLVLATFTETGAAAGTYAHVAAIDTAQFAGAKLVAKNVTALTTSAVIVVTAKKLDGTFAGLNATLSNHTIGHETDLSDTTQLYTDVTAISMASGGTAVDGFEIVAKTDRVLTAI